MPTLALPLNYQAQPLSPDIEDRRGNQSLIAPPPSLLDNIKSGLNTLGTKLQMVNTGLHHNWNPYWQAPVDPNFYAPGRDAASLGGQIAPSLLKPIKVR